MASSGPNNGGTFADDATVGTIAWGNPGRAVASDDSRAGCNEGNPPGATHYLKATNFGFAIPAGAKIDGIKVEAEIKHSSASTAYDNSIKLVKAGSYVGDNKARESSVYWPTSDAYVTWGGETDLWGTTWSVDEINNSGFGVGISGVFSPVYSTASIDHIRITVYYSSAITLTVANAAHTHSADAASPLVEHKTLAVAESAHSHLVDAVILTQVHNLVISDGGHTLVSDSLSLTQLHNLLVNECAHSLTSDVIALIQDYLLMMADSAHALASDNIALIEHKLLAMADSAHTLLSDNLDLTQVHNLSIADGGHTLASDSLTLTQLHNLLISGCGHVLTSDVIVLLRTYLLSVRDGRHNLTSDSFVLGQEYYNWGTPRLALDDDGDWIYRKKQ